MRFIDQVKQRFGESNYSNGWLLSDYNIALERGLEDVVVLLKPEIVRRWRGTKRDAFRRRAGIAIARTTAAEHASVCAFHVFNKTEPCDCGGLDAALKSEEAA